MRFILINLVSVLVLISEFQRSVECAKILGIFPLAGRSLNILYNKLMRGLADAGHNVTVISAFENRHPIKNGTLTDVVLTGFAESYERLMADNNFFETPESYSIWESLVYHKISIGIYENTFKHPNLQKFLREDHSFDAVIMEYFYSDSILAFAKIFNCHLILFNSLGGVNPYVNEMIGNPMPVSYVPHFFKIGENSNGMGFLNRLHNLLFYLYDPFIRNHITTFHEHNALLRKYISNPPDVSEIYYNASLLLSGSHPSISQATPLSPNTVEIGGFHIEPPKKLPEDLQEFLDNATDGAIFFSMGSHIKSRDFSEEKRSMMLNIFRKLKLKVVWKFENETLTGKPDNVLIKKWLPQMDVLAHPNVKLFISHAGYCSVMETIYHGVPALMIPVFLDQFNNAYRAQELGYALKLSYVDKKFTEETLSTMIQDLLTNPKYTERAKYLSSLFHDRPVKPMDAAVYWVEYVIRHNGANHLKVAGLKLLWYKYYMVDVLLSLILLFVILVYIVYSGVKLFIYRVGKLHKIKQN